MIERKDGPLNERGEGDQPEGDESNAPSDFPLHVEALDFAGVPRQFEITADQAGLGFRVEAAETRDDREEGYQFLAFDPSSPHLALGRLREKMARALSVRYLSGTAEDREPMHDVVAGRITYTDDAEEPGLVVDGRFLSWEHLGRMVASHEGWDFEFRFIDPTA